MSSKSTLNCYEKSIPYLLEHTVREADVLKALREYTATLPGGRMQIPPEQGQFFSLLVRLMGAKRTLDIGSFTGYSALWVALALPDEGRVTAIDHDPRVADTAKRFWQQAGVLEKIDFYQAPAFQVLQTLLQQGLASQYDFIFIDADKRAIIDY